MISSLVDIWAIRDDTGLRFFPEINDVDITYDLKENLALLSLFCDVYSVQSMKQMIVKVVDNLVIFESIFWTNGITGNRLDI